MMRGAGWLGMAVCAVTAGASAQSTWHVDPVCGDDAWSGLSDVCAGPDGPKRTIGAAIAGASDGDTVLLGPGVYSGAGNIRIELGKELTVRGREGAAATILDGLGDGPAFDVLFASPGFEGLTLRNFYAGFSGGAITMYGSDSVIQGCVFEQNRTGQDGGAVFAFDLSRPLIVNCVFVENTAATAGGAVAAFIGAADVINCTFIDNTADSDTAHSVWGFVEVHNSILRGGTDHIVTVLEVTYNNVEGGHSGEGNIDVDPLFVDAAAGDYRLSADSPSIDAGNSQRVLSGVVTDFAGLDRFVDDPATPDTGLGGPGGRAVVDIGAHEFQVDACSADCDGSGGLDLFDFLCFQNLFAAGDPDADCDGSGRLDVFDFLCFQNAFAAGCR
ncbi:MAG: GC-type dockerin domain-anchored protein [Phycisphaerales bacterium JB039]